LFRGLEQFCGLGGSWESTQDSSREQGNKTVVINTKPAATSWRHINGRKHIVSSRQVQSRLERVANRNSDGRLQVEIENTALTLIISP